MTVDTVGAPADIDTTRPRIGVADAIGRLPTADGKSFVTVLERDGVSVEFYAPVGEDKQTPHDRDEIYVIAAGSGTFRRGDTRTAFGPGDLLFVPAFTPHKFETFTTDLAAWVVLLAPRRAP